MWLSYTTFFDLTSFYRLGQKYENIFVRFLVQMKTLKSLFEINWPMGKIYPYPLAEYLLNIKSKEIKMIIFELPFKIKIYALWGKSVNVSNDWVMFATHSLIFFTKSRYTHKSKLCL